MKSRFLFVGILVLLFVCVSVFFLLYDTEKPNASETQAADSNSGKQLAAADKIVRKEKARGTPVATPASPLPEETRDYLPPQTSEALMAKFDANYRSGWGGVYDLDAHYPRAEWLQRVLDKGGIIKDSGDYMYYLDMRGRLLRNQENPDEWRSGKYGIPITTDFDEYTEGFIQRKVWENRIIQKVSAENPNESLTTVYFPSNHPDKYLPVVGKMTFVRIAKNREGMRGSGAALTREQRRDLLEKGIEPEDIEIVYIDDDYNVLSEPPPILSMNQRERLRTLENLYSFNGVPLTPENFESVTRHPMPSKWLENYEKRQARETPPEIPDTDAIRTAARSAAAAERERFQQGLRELERLTTMSDAELEAELERRLTPQLRELPTAENIENMHWSEVQSAQMTPARFEAALKILQQHGSEAGLQRLIKADPKAAAKVQRFLEHSPETEQPPAQQPTPVPQKHRVLPESSH